MDIKEYKESEGIFILYVGLYKKKNEQRVKSKNQDTQSKIDILCRTNTVSSLTSTDFRKSHLTWPRYREKDKVRLKPLSPPIPT